ncbi:hypothetical protein [Rhodococcus sp. NJ-530]|uniref:hypothetical protein n=1 Tax=Rhodococcus sp. NJ-530 TaxID=2490853 RepID=UPI00064234C8|nr:hypothetical protein [Rhodococcus sp. NJ-530]AZI65519.1 hypothetical protein EHW12_30845 [Rhodococcus sp. NJ-530]KLN72915.1 hypothetical protein ABM90_03465 [Rhodococcus erythropolis]
MTHTPPRITPISRQDAAAADPTKTCGPLVIDDGHVHAVGEAHGRLVPMVGQIRPFLYDAAFEGVRVYADRVDDVLAVMLGDRYAELTAALDELDLHPVPAPDESDLEPVDEIAAVAGLPPGDDLGESVSEAELAVFAAHMAYKDKQARIKYEMALIRRRHADGQRVRLQSAINDEAHADGSWLVMTDEQRALLLSAGDPNGQSPAGVIEEVPISIDGVDGTLIQTTVERGVWTADTRLVVNTGDYSPWEPIPFPESAIIRLDEHDEEVEVQTRSNLVILRIDTPDDYLESLSDAGLVHLKVTPTEQPDDFFRGAESILVDAANEARLAEGSPAQSHHDS